MPTTSTLGLAAIALARHGWPVIPCHHPVATRRCSCTTSPCPSAAKHPHTGHGLHDATTDPAQIKAWWQQWPQANIGIRTGAQPDGAELVIIDIDPAHGGTTSLTALIDAHTALPTTLAVVTGGAGQHLYFAHPGHVPSSTGRLGPGIDIRGDGGYIIAPPSRHTSGPRYQWANRYPIAPTPDWLLELITRPAETTPECRPASAIKASTDRWAVAALTYETDDVRHAPEGCRNHTLNRAAFSLGQLVAAGQLDAEQVTDALTAAALAAGLTPTETRLTITSGLRAGASRPRYQRTRLEPAALTLLELNGAGTIWRNLPALARHIPPPADGYPDRH